MFNVSTFSAIAALSFLFNVVVGGASHVLHDISDFICHCLMSVVQVDVISNSHHWCPTTVGGFLLSLCLPIVDTQVTLKLSIWSLVTLTISCPLPFFLFVWEKEQHQRSLRRQFKFHSKWLRNHPLFGSTEYEQTRNKHRQHKSYAKKSLKAVEKELKLAQLVELLSGYERLVREIKVAELLARYEDLVTPLYSLLVCCGFMISGLLDLVKYVYSSWLRVPSTSLSVNHKFHLSVIVPNGSITMVLVSNDSTVLEAKQAASLTVGLSLVGLQLYRPGRHWKRLPSSRTLYDLGLNPSTLVQLGPRPQSQSRSQSRNTKSSTLPTTFSHLDPVLTNPVMDETTVFRNPRLSQTRTKSDPTKTTAKNVVCHHTGIWFADINPQVSPSWSIPVDTSHTGGVDSFSNSLPVGKRTHIHLEHQPSLPTLSKSPKPTIYHPPFPPITLLDFIPPHVVARLGLSKAAQLVDSTLTQGIAVPQGDSPPPEPPPLLEPATVLNKQAAGYSLDSMSHQDWIPSPELALAVFGFLDNVSCVSQKRAIMSALFKSWSQLDECPPSIGQIELLDLSTTTVGTEQPSLSSFFVELVDGHNLFVEMPSMLTIRDLREFLYQERNVVYALSCTLVFGMIKLENWSLLPSLLHLSNHQLADQIHHFRFRFVMNPMKLHPWVVLLLMVRPTLVSVHIRSKTVVCSVSLATHQQMSASSAVSPTLPFVRSDSNFSDALTAPEPSLFVPYTVSDSEADSVSSQSVQSDFESVADGEDGDIDYELLNQFQRLGFDDSASDLDSVSGLEDLL
ncbi:hypothetical protein BCR33DRAFT_717902, partial [Rhizoclosmatium globosum]